MNGKRAREARRTPRVITASPQRGVEMDAQMALDREYFREHPDAEWYVRRRLRPDSPPGMTVRGYPYTLVRQLRPGMRTKMALTAEKARELEALRAAGVEVFFEDLPLEQWLRDAWDQHAPEWERRNAAKD